ncbi:MAG: serine/threonine protein kinase [Chloroflexi bacterium]|nr:serine/threonine protein kinase [Chloroflexota bacterium]
MTNDTAFIPRQFGPYRVERELASGSMGTLYRATHTGLDRPVALKLLRPGTMRDPESLHRFRTEARSVASLEHANIVPVYDAGEIDGVPYIAMKLLEGESLYALLARTGALPADRALHIAAQLARALDYAHGRGVVHLDVTPMNVMVTSGDRVVLSDFGVAQGLRPGAAPSAAIIGTPLYMAPERIQGQDVDGRSDVYSLGIIIYEMCAGRPPFEGDCASITEAHVHQSAPDVRAIRPEIPDTLATAIDRALAKDPSGRFQTAGELLRALERAALRPVLGGAPRTPGRGALPPADGSDVSPAWRPGLATERIDAVRGAPAPMSPQGRASRTGGDVRAGRGLALAICALALVFGPMALLLSRGPSSQHARAFSLLPAALSMSGPRSQDLYVSGGTVTLRWTGVPHARVYRLQLAALSSRPHPADFGHPLRTDLVESTSRTVRVVGRQAYSWRVQALVDGRWGPYTAAKDFTVAPPAVGTPRLLSPQDGASSGAARVRLCWSHVAGADGYRVRVTGLRAVGARSTCIWLPVRPQTYSWSVSAYVQGAGLYSGRPSARRRFTVRRPPSPAPTPQQPTPVPSPTARPAATAAPSPSPTVPPPTAVRRTPTAKAQGAPTLAPPPTPTVRPTVAPPTPSAVDRSRAGRTPTVGPTASPTGTPCDPEVDAC